MVRKLRAASRHWVLRALGLAWVRWVAESTGRRRRRVPLLLYLAQRRTGQMRGAWLAWRLEIFRFKRDWLGSAFARRLQSDAAHAFRHWREVLAAERDTLDTTLTTALVFRRWSLLRQTQMLTRLLLRDALSSMDAELSGTSGTAASARRHELLFAGAGVAPGGMGSAATSLPLNTHVLEGPATTSCMSMTVGPPRRAHFATPLTGK